MDKQKVKMKQNKFLKGNKGITLIALVITIIVLLILAGVSIAMLTGPNGLLTQASDAKTKTSEAGAKEKVQIAVASSWGENGFDAEKFKTEVGRFAGEVTPGTEKFPIKVAVDGQNFEVSEEGVVTEKGKDTTGGDTVTPGVKVTGSNKTYENNGKAVIPVGFAIVPGLDDVSQGLVISDKENDTDNKGNQFVWIPVENEEVYKTNTTYFDTNISRNTENDTEYLPDDIDIGEPTEEKTKEELTFEKEKELVTSKGGFYISRYEAGDSSVETNRESATDGTLVSKKDAYVYNYIKQIDAKEKAKTFINDKNVKSALASGVQWDMVMAFISKETRIDGKGNEYNVTKASDDSSSDDTSDRHDSTGLKQCGQNEADRVCNIYDLEGNCNEYVAEKNTYTTFDPYVRRGGRYNSSYSASYRNSSSGNAISDYSFRFVLYVM